MTRARREPRSPAGDGLRVLMVASTVPADADDAVPGFVLDQALALAQADARVTVRILAPHTPRSRAAGPWPRAVDSEGRVTHQRFGYAPRAWETLTSRGIMPAIRERGWRAALVPLLVVGERRALHREAREWGADVIYAHWFTPQAIVASGVARRRGIPFGFTTHASDVAVLARLGAVGRRIVRRVTGRAAFATAVSRQTADRLLGFFAGRERDALAARLVVAPMGTSAPAHSPADVPARSSAPMEPHTVSVIARLVEKKGIHLLLDAWPTVRAAVPDARLIVAGDGPWRARLQAQAGKLGTADDAGIEFTGYVSGAAKRAVEERAAVAAFPSVVAADGDADGFPVAAVEALARGALIVASDQSGLAEALEAPAGGVRAGTVVAAGDTRALALAVIEAMTLADGPRAARVAAARERGAALTWDALAPATVAMLREAAEARA